jgi:hypothetical protein
LLFSRDRVREKAKEAVGRRRNHGRRNGRKKRECRRLLRCNQPPPLHYSFLFFSSLPLSVLPCFLTFFLLRRLSRTDNYNLCLSVTALVNVFSHSEACADSNLPIYEQWKTTIYRASYREDKRIHLHSTRHALNLLIVCFQKVCLVQGRWLTG